MKVSAEGLENCQIALNIEAEGGELDKSLDEAYRHLVSEISVPGFRKGKAPRAILEQHIGKSHLVQEALQHLIPQLYEQAVQSQKLEPIARPEIEVIQIEPLVFKAIVSLEPEIKLGNYQGLNVESAPTQEITDKEVSAALTEFRQRQGAWVPAARPAELGDLVTMDIQANVEGKPWLSHKGILYEMDKDSASPVPGFASSLRGAEKNKQKVFALTIPDDYHITEMQGKESTFEVMVTEVKEKQLPDLNDELARRAGYDNLDNMKTKVADGLRAKAEAIKRQELRQKVLDALMEISTLDYPPILEDEEIDELLRNQAHRLGFQELADYLKKANKKEEEIRQELRPIAKKRVARRLVLGRLAEEEKIEISSAEVDNRIEEMVIGAEDKEKGRQFLSLPRFRQSIEQTLRTEKTMERLLQIAVGNAQHTAKED
jgi:trigger factor